MRLIKRSIRERVREIARQNYVIQTGERDAIAFRAMVGAQRQIKQEFGSGIITSLLMSIMIKLAWKYIEQWVEDKLFAQHVPEQFEEAR
jgi:hypothetical protein